MGGEGAGDARQWICEAAGALVGPFGGPGFSPCLECREVGTFPELAPEPPRVATDVAGAPDYAPFAEALGDLEWVALSDLIHQALLRAGIECPDNGDQDAGVCHDIADAIQAAGLSGSTDRFAETPAFPVLCEECSGSGLVPGSRVAICMACTGSGAELRWRAEPWG